MSRLAVLAPIVLAGCAAGDEDSWMTDVARSPDGRHVARLWCEHLCDVEEDVTLTVSPATRPVPLHQNGGPPLEGVMPEGDVAWRGNTQPISLPSHLRWRDATTIEVALPCIAGQAGKGAWRIAMVDTAPPGRCRR